MVVVEQMKVNLGNGYLFRPTNPQGAITSSAAEGKLRKFQGALTSSAAEGRLKTCIKEMSGHTGETLHGFLSGRTITLASPGVELSEVMDHVY